LLALSYAGAAVAFGVPDLFQDPLFTRPPVLERGAALPGDESPLPCPAQIELRQALTLGDAVDLALCNNPQIKTTWAAIKVQAGLVGESRATYLPTINGTYNSLQNRVEYPEFQDSNTSNKGHTTYLAFNWRLFDFGGRDANHESASLLLEAALASHEANMQKTLSAVISAYFEALTAQATLDARSLSAQLAQETLDATQRRLKLGAAGRNDTLQASTAWAKARLAQQRAFGDRHKSLSALVYAIGLPAGTAIILAQVDAVLPNEAVLELSHWLSDAQTRHPAIVAAKAQWESAKKKITVARSEGLPTMDYVTNFYQNGYPNQGLQQTKSNTTTFGVSFNIPFFEGFGRTYKIRGAQAQAEQSEAQMRDVEHQILTEVVKAHADAQASLANLASSERLLDSALESEESSQRRYNMGAADILERLSVQSALADAQQERIRCLAEWRSARLRLMANAGMLGRHSLRPR
jgi:outer membrane protein